MTEKITLVDDFFEVGGRKCGLYKHSLIDYKNEKVVTWHTLLIEIKSREDYWALYNMKKEVVDPFFVFGWWIGTDDKDGLLNEYPGATEVFNHKTIARLPSAFYANHDYLSDTEAQGLALRVAYLAGKTLADDLKRRLAE